MRLLPPCRLHIYRQLLLARRHTAYSHRRRAIPPHRRHGLLPQVPSPTFMTATAFAIVTPVSCAEVRWVGYVHVRRCRPSSLFKLPGDALVPPLSCCRGQRDTPVPPCVAQYSHHTVPGAGERPLYLPELVPGPRDAPALSLISPRGPRGDPMPPGLHQSSSAGSTPYNPRRRGCCPGPTRCPSCQATTRPNPVARVQGYQHIQPTPRVNPRDCRNWVANGDPGAMGIPYLGLGLITLVGTTHDTSF